MGDIKKQKKKYSTPSHPWQGARIEEEKGLLKEYGLKNKKEVWKMGSILRRFYSQAKKLTISNTNQSEIEKNQLLAKLSSLGLLEQGGKLEDVLAITIKDIMGRRIQTLLFKKSLARTINQARQFITHGHVFVGEKAITMPSYLVSREEESVLSFKSNSALASIDHPERAIEEKKEKPKEEKPKKKEVKKKESKESKKETKESKKDNKDTKAHKKEEKAEKPDKVEEEA